MIFVPVGAGTRFLLSLAAMRSNFSASSSLVCYGAGVCPKEKFFHFLCDDLLPSLLDGLLALYNSNNNITAFAFLVESDDTNEITHVCFESSNGKEQGAWTER
jgi:hypothetical protein